MLAVPQTLPDRRVSFAAAFRFARGALWQHFFLFAAMLITFVAAWIVLEVVVVAGQRLGIVLWAGAHLAFLVFFAGLEAGLAQVCLDLVDGGTPGFGRVFSRLALGPRLLAGQIVYLLLVLAGLALLVVPGLYLAGRWALFGYRLVDRAPDLLGSFRPSPPLNNAGIWQLALLSAALLVLNVLGAGVLGIGLFVTVPFSVLVMAAVYRQLSVASNTDNT